MSRGDIVGALLAGLDTARVSIALAEPTAAGHENALARDVDIGLAGDPRRRAPRVSCCSMGSKNTAIVAATLVLAACGMPAGIANADPPAPPPGPKTTIDHDGTYTVGTDIVPGTYSSAGPVGKGTCYWKRLSSPNGKDIIDNAMTKEPQVVEIEPSDNAFTTHGCQPWQKTDSADATPPAELPPSAAQGQLQTIIGGLNGAARQSGAGQVPGP